MSDDHSLKSRVAYLYGGRGRWPRVFRYGLLAFDLLTISFFLVASMISPSIGLLAADYAIAFLLIVDFGARLWIAPRRARHLMDPLVIADLVVIATLLAPTFIENFAFLRVIRALRLLRSYHVVRDLRHTFPGFQAREDLVQSVVNLFVFIFLVTALVYVMQVDHNPQINTYVDALYFTVTTLTTTGFGDITLTGNVGRLVAVMIMVLGVALFLRLVQTIFMPQKVRHTCPTCGLKRHDVDAVHCKHCGEPIRIETEGA